MKKRIIALLLVLVMMFSLTAYAAPDDQGEDPPVVNTCDGCGAVMDEEGNAVHSATCITLCTCEAAEGVDKSAADFEHKDGCPVKPVVLCATCDAAEGKNGVIVHGPKCITHCICEGTMTEKLAEGFVHMETCKLYEEPVAIIEEISFYEKLMEIESLAELHTALKADENAADAKELSKSELQKLIARAEDFDKAFDEAVTEETTDAQILAQDNLFNAVSDLLNELLTKKLRCTCPDVEGVDKTAADYVHTAEDCDFYDASAIPADDKAPEAPEALCEQCEATEGENGEVVHAATCPTQCTCTPVDGVHAEGCKLYVAPTFAEIVLAAETLADMKAILTAAENEEALNALTDDEVLDIADRIEEIYAETDEEDLEIELMTLLMTKFPVAFGMPATLANNNVHNVTQNKWYSTLSAATAAATDGNVIEVHNSFTETVPVKIQKQNLTIRAAAGKNPVIKWSGVLEAVDVTGATPYHCVVIYTSVTTSTTFGGGTGTLTFDASGSSGDAQKGKRARVMVHCGHGTLNIMDGIVLTGGNTGGGNYESHKNSGPRPSWSGEIEGELGFGAGLFMRLGTLNMSGGVIKDNYSLWAHTTDHNYVGGGGGVYLYDNTIMNMYGGTINHNAAGSGGGGGVLVGYGSTLNMSGGTISENVSRFASGGGIGVRTNSKVTITGGNIIYNHVEGHGGGLFARGDSIPLKITGGRFEGNTAGSYGGGILFWTVGDDVNKNTVVIGDNVQIKNNKATNGGGISVGREVLEGKPIGNQAKLIIQGNPVISGNTATGDGGGIHMQSDEFSAAVNTVEISGGTFSKNSAVNGAGIYVPGGTVTMTGGNFTENTASNRGAGIFTGGGTMTISDATFVNNTAGNFGGGAYVVGGSVVMNSGDFTNNTALSGGALYITKEGTTTASNFTMISGTMTGNQAIGTTGTGGGAYVNGGDVVIGVANCSGAGTNHTVAPTNKIHPVVSNNTAKDSGGGIAVIGNGDITMYCGDIVENNAINRGRGLNVYMEQGTFTYYKGDIGSLGNPELVIVGGRLNDTNKEGTITLRYHHCNNITTFPGDHTTTYPVKTAVISKDAYFNLPDGEKYWTAPSGYRFFGWTFNGDGANADYVRNKDDYEILGQELKADDSIDQSNVAGEIVMYALWAPITNNIFYPGSIVNGAFLNKTVVWPSGVSHDTTYTFSVEDKYLVLNDPLMPGHTLQGWYIYQNPNQNANWGYEPVYKNSSSIDTSNLDFTKLTKLEKTDGVYKINTGDTHFGNISLIPIWEENVVDINYKAMTKDYGAQNPVEKTTDSGGTLSATRQENLRVLTGEPTGSTATANKGYTFMGWYSDEQCTQKVSDDAAFVPTKANDAMWEDETTYYALFVEQSAEFNFIEVTENYNEAPAVSAAGGTVEPKTTIIGIITGAPSSVANPAAGYDFVGWFSDVACTVPVTDEEATLSGDGKTITPKKVDDKFVADNFYAKFVEQTATINYVVKGPDGCGTVNPESETIGVVTDVAQGSTAVISSATFKFVGWFTDEACTTPVTADDGTVDGNKFTPAAPATGTLWEGATYYAKFEYDVADLQINKEVDNAEDQSFLFHVNGIGNNGTVIDMDVMITGEGSVKIKDLPIGRYTITEDTAWSWRYSPTGGASQTITLKANIETANKQFNEVTFENERNGNTQWLNFNFTKTNIFADK